MDRFVLFLFTYVGGLREYVDFLEKARNLLNYYMGCPSYKKIRICHLIAGKYPGGTFLFSEKRFVSWVSPG